ncbi:hypothetical protein [Methylibium petroleiphilum]|uniref:Uncharacterized protein n=1 Tax=Methylibium petroleiphilum (strain ATCC BAA-1232 / LMG 22953 / PM1) TaxID=420662 RepID=A2SNB9_METPP|nr:hypothetical protein [Methylibium petroleiphilum]ABM97058.1 hypothetical protein Mpe_B0283 [Methylibium petroleiphilum PM1]
MDWFEVDKKGLAKLLERKGKAWVLYELLQNAWDENTTRVHVTLERIPGARTARLVVRDDNPTGFSDLSHAWRLYAESGKKADAAKRGRYNLGEKLVLSLCDEAEISTTTGTVRFDATGRHVSRVRIDRGSVFTGLLRITNTEIVDCARAVRELIPPPGIETFYNGDELPRRAPIASFEATLATVLADEEGYLRRTERKTVIEVYEPFEGEVPSLYELGVPVVETGDRWHLNVQQKVPLNPDRDNVPPGYLARLRALVVAHMADKLQADDANSSWVRDAIQKHGDLVPDAAISRMADLRFGEKRVAFDPSDPEANNRAVEQGYTLVYGSQLSKAEWEAMRRSGAVRPAGQVTPTSKPFSEDGDPLRTVSEADWTDDIRAVVEYARRVLPLLVGGPVHVTIASDVTWPFAGAYGSRRLTLNLGRLGHKWFSGPLEAINDLLLHEAAHEFASNHLSAEYHDALSRLGAKLTSIALRQPELFELRRTVEA